MSAAAVPAAAVTGSGHAPRLRVAVALAGLHAINRGAEVALENIARGLAGHGLDVTVFGSGPERAGEPYRFVRAPRRDRRTFESWPRVPPFRSELVYEEATFAWSLRRRYRPDSFDAAITCAYPFTHWALRRTSRGYRPASIFITQNGDYPARAINREYKYFACDGLVCTNPEYFERHRERYHSALIPNGVDASRFTLGPSARAALGLPENGPIVLMCSALIASKRVLEGVRAVAGVPGAMLVVAGDGPLRAEVETLAGELLPGRFQRVSLTHAQMPDLYRSADVMLHMSRDEPFGNVYLEAMSTGLPIVAHDNTSSRWIMEDAASLVDTGDLDAVSAQIRAAIERGRQSGTRGRRIVEARFDWPVVAAAYADFVRQVAAGRVRA